MIPRAVSYLRTIVRAIGLCFLALVLRSVLLVVASMQHASQEGGFGFAITRGGIIEALLTSIVLGWLLGTMWYLVRRRPGKKTTAI
jgi:hypothetical protein